MLAAYSDTTGKEFYRAIPAMTRDLGLNGLIRKAAPISRLLRQVGGTGTEDLFSPGYPIELLR